MNIIIYICIMSPYATINSPMVKLYETGNPPPTKTKKYI